MRKETDGVESARGFINGGLCGAELEQMHRREMSGRVDRLVED